MGDQRGLESDSLPGNLEGERWLTNCFVKEQGNLLPHSQRQMMCVPPGPEQERGKGEVLGLSWGPFKGDTDASSYKS